MAARIHKSKAHDVQKTGHDDETVTVSEKPDTTITDELLDEIDSVLETNAAEFVRSYIQKGGQ